ncbi:MAG: HPP family protein [Thiohalospira sp.]
MRTRDWLRDHPRDPLLVPHGSPTEEAAARLLEDGHRDLFVTDDEGAVCGHIGHLRIARLLLAERRPHLSRRHLLERVAGGTAADLVERHFAHAGPEEELHDVLHRLLDHDQDELAILDEEHRPLGVIDLTAVLRARLTEDGEG